MPGTAAGRGPSLVRTVFLAGRCSGRGGLGMQAGRQAAATGACS
jgi:hypothetical protein